MTIWQNEPNDRDRSALFVAEETAASAARRLPTPGDAYAMATKAPLLTASRWSAACGGGDRGRATVGSQDAWAKITGSRRTPLLGFALAEGGAVFSLANGLGGGFAEPL
jgi:hypothetical protein